MSAFVTSDQYFVVCGDCAEQIDSFHRDDYADNEEAEAAAEWCAYDHNLEEHPKSRKTVEPWQDRPVKSS